MKTAISLPNRLYEDAERTAKSLGIPRSQLFAKALEEFINHHKREHITDKLNEVYGAIEPGEESLVGKASLESMRDLTQDDAW